MDNDFIRIYTIKYSLLGSVLAGFATVIIGSAGVRADCRIVWRNENSSVILDHLSLPREFSEEDGRVIKGAIKEGWKELENLLLTAFINE